MEKYFHIAWQYFGRLARNKWAAVAFVFAIAFILSALITLSKGVPEPYFTDEYSYLLASDTFSQGRLTNPTHPMWKHFSSFHIFHTPTYASKYPPGQGFFLAIGQVITGYTVVGVWLSMALMCAAITWMLQAWVPSRWALVGGLLSVFHIYLGVASYWGQSYMGGAVAGLGGALFFGGWRRILKRPDFKMSLILALGFAVLLNSRPWEGVMVSIPAAFILIVFIVQKSLKEDYEIVLKNMVTPIAIVAVVTLIFIAYYNYRVTGNALLLPYRHHQITREIAPHFIWGKPRQQLYHHQDLLDFQRLLVDLYQRHLTLDGFIAATKWKFQTMWKFFGGEVLVIPLIFSLFWVFRDRWLRFTLLTIGFYLVATMLSSFYNTYYSAPITCLVFFLIAQGLRVLSKARISNKYIGKYLINLLLVICIVLFVNKWIDLPSQKYLRKHYVNTQVVEIAENLKEQGGEHLILVRYLPGHNFVDEWVYNKADIDSSKIVWAREMGPEDNQELLKYFKNRKAWLLVIGDPESKVDFSPYPRDS